VEAATGFESVNNGFAESINVSNYLKLFLPVVSKLLIFFFNLQPVRNQFLCFAKGWKGERIRSQSDLLF